MPRASLSHKRCAIYTRKSSEEGLEQEFNSLAAQRDACEAYIRSQQHEGWTSTRARYDDGGFSGGSMERPALQSLLADIRGGRIDIVVVYKVDRLTRSLADFARLVEIFDTQGVSFVSVTQQFNTTSSMGRLTLNVLLSFAQFEREVTGERIRDKIAASALIKAIARGRAWFEELASGRARSLHELAKRDGISRRYIRRLVNLAFLSPKLIEAMLQGRQPVELTATRLTELDLPLDWTEQHSLLAS